MDRHLEALSTKFEGQHVDGWKSAFVDFDEGGSAIGTVEVAVRLSSCPPRPIMLAT